MPDLNQDALLQNQAPSGFDIEEYFTGVCEAFVRKFQPNRDLDVPNGKDIAATGDIFKEISFAEAKDFENLDIKLPACVLDLQGAKLNPTQEEFEHKNTSIYSNLGETELYAFMKAYIIVSNRSKNPDPLTEVRKLAFDVAGFVTSQSRFGQPVGMSQITHVQRDETIEDRERRTVTWEVRWQHSISLGEPFYDTICPDPMVDVNKVKEVRIGFNEDADNPVITESTGNPDDADTDIDESEFDTKVGYTAIYRTPDDEDDE